jgi:hypothetical protein
MGLPAQLQRLGIPDEVELVHGDILFLRWDAYQQCFRALVSSNQPPTGFATLTDAAKVIADGSRGSVFNLTFTAGIGDTRAMGKPINLFDLEVYDFRCIQDSVGGRSIDAWDAIFDFHGETPTFQAGANLIDRFMFRYDAHADKLTYLGQETP